MKPRYLCMAILSANLALPVYAFAANNDLPEADRGAPSYSDREHMKRWTGEKDRLRKALRVGEGKDYYRKELTNQGYRITAVNYSDRDYLEYEVVKNPNTYEVQISFDETSGKARKIDVTTNMWQAEATKKALQDANYKVEPADTTAATSSRYSDRDRMKTWTNEKERLEKQLKAKQDKDYYARTLEDLGYRITAVNKDEPSHVEYEVVKGQDSYEVQIDLDPKTGKAKKVDVTTNLWQADATDKALERRND